MNAKHRRCIGSLASLGVALCAATCIPRDDPTGVSGVPEAGLADPGRVYPDERRAVELARALPDLAGFFFDTSGNVIVRLKGVGESQAKRKSLLRPTFGRELSRGRLRNPAADVIVRTATYSFLELKEWRDRLIDGNIMSVPGVVWLDLDEVQNHVVIGLDVGADPVAPRLVAQDLGVPAEAIDFDVTGPYVSQQTLRDAFRPIQGGIQIQRVSGAVAVSCTLGFTALRNNQQVFLTAGHCSPNLTGTDSVAQFQPLAPLTHADSATMSAIGREILQYSEPCGSRRCSYSDAAIYGLIPSQTWGLGRIARPALGCFPGPCSPPVLDLDPRPYWVIDTTYEAFVVNDVVSKIGSATGWSQGSVSRTCVDVSPSSGVTYRCQMFATYGADDGDSGSPILLDIQGGADSTVTLGGIHSGRVGSSRAFSPWSGIVQDYGSLSVVRVAQAEPVPETAPDTIPAWIYADSNLITNSARLSAPFVRDVVDVLFASGTPQSQRQAAIDQIGGQVIGGSRFPDGDGYYLVRIPDDGSDSAVFAAIDTLKALSYVRVATVEMLLEDPTGYLRPNDGQGWTRTDWAVNPDSARGVNWSLEAVAAPLAWGCTTGDPTTVIGVVDNVFRDPVADLQANVNQVERPNAYPALFPHGTAVASALGAEGSNGIGITGLMWHARLRMHEVGQFTSQGTPVVNQNGQPVITNRGVAAAFVRAANGGARVVNLSLFRPWRAGAPHTAADTGVVFRMLQPMIDALRFHMPPRGAPLLTVIAGNNGLFGPQLDAFWSGYPALADTFPGQVLVVGAHDITRAYAQFADTGHLVTIAAPGVDVMVLGAGGNPVTRSGTSLAAPYASGLAGLLLAFDSSLTRDDLYRLVVEGARRGGRVAGAVPTINAYESLRLAAQRPGAPLCGNRVWVNNNAVIVERDASMHTTEQIISLGEPASFVNARHGGHRVEVSAQSRDRAFELRQGQWVETSDTATTPHGGTFVSMLAFSHDLDSAVTTTYWTTPDSSAFEQTVFDYRTGTQTRLDTLWVPTARFTDQACIRIGPDGACEASFPTGVDEAVIADVVFPPVGGRLLLAVTYVVTRDVALGAWAACPVAPGDPNPQTHSCRSISYEERTERAVLWAVDVRTRQETSLWTFPGRVYWFGVSETGAELVAGEGVRTTAWTWRPNPDGSGTIMQEWSNPGTVTGCGIRYRSLTSGVEVAPQIATASACTTQGPGTIAPAPPRAASP